MTATPPSAASPATAAAPAATPDQGLGLRLVLLATMAAWGANLSVVKWLLQTLEPTVAALLRMVVSALMLLGWMLWRRLDWRAITRAQWGQLLLCGVVMMYLNQLFLTQGIQRTAAANASLIIALNPLVASLLAAVLLGDRLTPARVAGVALGFAGVAAVVLHRPGMALGQGSLGDVLLLGAVLTWVAGGMLVQRLARQLDTALISVWVTTIGAALLALQVALDPSATVPPLASLSATHWVLIGLSGLLASAVGGLVWNHALRTLGVARTALYAYWVPIFGVLFAVTLLGEPLSVWHAVGLAAVLGGTWLGTRR